jgi:hypothetical protein
MDLLQRQEQSDWAYIDLLISRYKDPNGARLSLFKSHDNQAQQRFRAKVFKAYDGIQKSDYEERFWCCISGKWYSSSTMRAAHIVPYNIGELNASYLFGLPADGAEQLMNPRNGLPMSTIYENYMDEGRFALVPVENSNDIKVVVFDTNPDGYMEEINGKILSFRNDFRPAKRYLCFAFVTTLLRRQRHDVPGAWRNCREHGMQEIWASPGEYLRHSTLTIMARRIAHMPPNEASAFVNTNRGNFSMTHAHPRLAPQSEEKDRLCSDSVSVSFASKGPSTVDHSNDDDDEEDDHDPFADKGKGKSKVPSKANNKFSALDLDDD